MDRPRILVIDDARVMRMLLRTWLEQLGFSVTEAENGETGLRRILDGAADVVFCDINMPGISGLTVLDRVRSHADTADVPFVLLTTLGHAEDVRRGQNLGASRYLTKPLQFVALAEAMEDIMRQWTQRPSPNGDDA